MPRPSSSFKKRQKERNRLEKQREKAEKRAQRRREKQERGASSLDDAIDFEASIYDFIPPEDRPEPAAEATPEEKPN